MNTLYVNDDIFVQLQERAEQDQLPIEALLERWLDMDRTLPTGSSYQPDILLQQVSDAVISTDRNLIITSWNKAAELIYGWTEAEALGQQMDHLLRTEWGENTQSWAQTALATTGHWRGEIRQYKKGGQHCCIWASVNWIRNQNGEIVGGITINRDITESKLAENKLRESEEKYRLIAENTTDGIIIIEAPSTKVLYASPAYDRQWGRSPGTTATFNGNDIYELIHPDDRDQTFAKIFQAIAQKSNTLIYSYRAKHSDDHYIWREDLATFNYDEDGTHINTYVISRDITDRKDAEEALRESEDRYRALVNNVPHAIAIVAINKYIFINPAGAQMLGYASPDDIIGVPIFEIIAPKYHGVITQRLNRLTSGEPNTLIEFEIVRADGTTLWVESRSSLIMIKGQQAALIVAMDVTERKQAEQALHESAARLRSLIELQTTYVVRTDLDGNYSYVNDAFFNKLGWIYPNKAAMIGTLSLLTIVPEDHEKTVETVNTCCQQPGIPVQVILRKPTPEGGFFWTLWEFVALADATGTLYEIQCVGIDITELIKAREQLQLQENALLAAANAILITDRNGMIEWANPAFTSLTGFSFEEARGRKTNLLRSGVHNDEYYKILWDTILSGQVWRGRLINKRKDGSVYVEEQTITPVRDSNGDISHFVAIKQDITEREQAEQMRLEQERLKSNLKKEQELNSLIQKAVSALSHDIRTPLSVIATSKEVLERYFDRLDEEKRRHKLDLIDKQLHYVLQLLNDLSMTVKGSLDHRIFKPEPINLAALCQISITEIQETSGHRHHLSFVNNEHIQTAQLDETLVTRILLNLLTNAVKFSPEGSEIRLDLRRREDWLVLSVIDQGMGISKDEQTRIFDPFYRSEKVSSISGVGLGLNIVKDCVERHQGTIGVTSELGQGTTFTVELPYIMA